jgi:hypothetical protein
MQTPWFILNFNVNIALCLFGIAPHQQALDTSRPSGRAMFQMCGVFAEIERGMICERVNAGLARDRAKGKRLGGVRSSRRSKSGYASSRPKAWHSKDRSDGRSRHLRGAGWCRVELRHEQGDRPSIYGPGCQTHRTTEGPPLGTREVIDRLKPPRYSKTRSPWSTPWCSMSPSWISIRDRNRRHRRAAC